MERTYFSYYATNGFWVRSETKMHDSWAFVDAAKAEMLLAAINEIRILAVDADLRATFHRTALELIAKKAATALDSVGELS